MYKFLMPHLNDHVMNIGIRADSLAEAFNEFISEYWEPRMTGSIAVYQDRYLCARIMPVVNGDSGECRPFLQEWS
jgi:hypothetical protein